MLQFVPGVYIPAANTTLAASNEDVDCNYSV